MDRKINGPFKILLLALGLIFLSSSSLPGQGMEQPLRIGVASMITPVDAVKYYQDIVDYISEELGVPVEMVFRKSYSEMDRMLERGDVDVAFICSAPYVENKRKFGVELLVAPQVSGSAWYRSYIIVHKDSAIDSFDELEGKAFAYTDPKSNSGKMYPDYRLFVEKGLRPEKFYRKYIYSYSHNKSIELVAKRVVDGAAVESLVYDYMRKKGSPYVAQTKIIEKSPEFGSPPIVVSTRLPTFLKERLREVLLRMHLEPKGKKILDAMFIDRFVSVPDENYDSIRRMEAVLSKLAGDVDDGERGQDKTVNFGVIPRDNPRIAYEKYQPILDYLTDVTPYRFNLVLKKSYEDTINSLGVGDLDVALLDPLTYLEAHARYGARPLLKSVTDRGEPFSKSVVIAKKGNSVKNLSDLKGKSFAFASLRSTSGNLIPRYLLAGAGIHLKDLKKYRNFNYHDSVVKRVLRGEYDAGAVREAVAEKYRLLGLDFIAFSEPIPTGPVVAGPKTSPAVVEVVEKALLSLSKTGKGRKVLRRLDPELRGGFIKARDSDYANIRLLINDVPKTCGLGCHPNLRL